MSARAPGPAPPRRHGPDARELEERRSFRRRLVASGLAHVAVAGLIAFAPAPSARPLPPVVTVDLVAAARPMPARPAAKPAPKPAPVPAALPKPKPPPPTQKKVVLPKKPPPATRPKKVVAPKPRPRPQELEYEDALAALRDELGEAEPQAPADEPPPEPIEDAEAGSGGAGVQVSPELMRWITDTRRHIRSTYITPPEFLDRSLRTCLSVLLTADGRVLGEPQVVQSSGDVYWDDNAVRATLRASPLPAPPQEGDWTFCYPTEERD